MEKFHFRKLSGAKTKLYSHTTLPGLYELVPVGTPKIHAELNNCCYFLDYVELIKVESNFYVVILHNGADLDVIRSQNEYIEETYLSLILRIVIDAITYLHSKNFFNLGLDLSNWRLLPCGSLKAKNRFSLTRYIPDAAKDFHMFKEFTEKLCEIGNLNDPEICISAQFKNFLAKVAKLNHLNNDSEPFFSQLREDKFIKKQTNPAILSDLIEDIGYLSDGSQLANKAKPDEQYEKSESSVGHQDHIEEKFVTVSNKVFDKYIEAERREGNEKNAAILDTIKKTLGSLYKSDSKKATKLLKFYIK